ncbi:MAG: hypothetical protein ACKO8P_07410 [Actinomycetota bacterium]
MIRKIQLIGDLNDLIGNAPPTVDDLPISNVGVVLDTPEKVRQFLAELRRLRELS